ncbi:hypothetical protein SAMN02745119_00205 [Trichlorobacter thiogenes]|uniref:Lipoprotein n=1 Tax=Trichlorobacter thiogenes TaxID=115783 RepID=A0A1T4JZM0_9BACT|nr:hypothetical protein [Trichlorobacter thiogenes]SJZ35574.1 hypothetical protein SAMN02745119_00205 [Trichlorobacter thiogenes]
MQRLVLLMGLLLLPLLGGCAHNYYNLPQDAVAEKVKVLGVVPIIVDTDSDIRHPQREELITLLTNVNRSFERDLLRLVKNTNSFYTVTLLDADPKAVFSSTLFRRERRDDAAIQYNKYFWKEDALADFMRKNSLDAVMFVIVSGITRPDKISSSNLLDSLTTDYNFLVMTAQIVDAKATILWEYPNFRQRTLSYNPLMNLQYPDFDEAKANMSPRVQVKFKTLEGIRRSLEKRRLDLLRRETPEVELYMSQFEDMTSMLEIDKDRKPAPPAPKKDEQETKK